MKKGNIEYYITKYSNELGNLKDNKANIKNNPEDDYPYDTSITIIKQILKDLTRINGNLNGSTDNISTGLTDIERPDMNWIMESFRIFERPSASLSLEMYHYIFKLEDKIKEMESKNNG